MFDKKSPYEIQVKAGQTVYICRCGDTHTPPFCDGSHKAHPGITPHAVTVEKDQTLFLCGCGNSANLPHCDGTHNKTQ